MKVRFAKIFNGNKKTPSYKTELQYFDAGLGRWVAVETEWASREDEEKYTRAELYEYNKGSKYL